jgi:chromosome segregation ATPase
MAHDKFEFTVDLDSLAARIENHRATCEQFLDARRKRLDSVEQGLLTNLQEISQQYTEWQDFGAETDKNRLAMKKERQLLERDRADLESRKLELEERALDTQDQRRRITKKIKEQLHSVRRVNVEKVRELETTLTSLRSELDVQTRRRKAADEESNGRGEQLEAARVREEELASLRSELDVQTQQRQAADEESKGLGEQLEAARVREEELASLRLELDVQTQQRQAADEESNGRGEQLEAARVREEELRSQVSETSRVAEERGRQIQTLREESGEATTLAMDAEQLQQLQTERDQLMTNVRKLQQELKENSDVDDEQLESHKQEIEELKEKNESLQQQLKESKQNRGAAVQNTNVTDWECRKQELLRELDSDESVDSQTQEKVNAAIEAIETSDRVVAAKDVQISDLQAKLKQLVEMVEGQEQQQQALNDDERIAVEQNRLQDLQKQWNEKVRHAEVEIAVQRADFSRQQSELDEKTRDVKAQLALAKKQVALQAGDVEKKKRGWLKR